MVSGLGERHDAEVAAEQRAAARLLLAHPLVTATGPHADTFRLVRRHAEQLEARFSQVFCYRLVVDATFSRLVKPGLGTGSGRRLRRSTGAPFTPRTYAYLTLALSVLVTAGEQILLSQLVAGMRSAAVDAGIEIADLDRQSERRTVAAALGQLLTWEVLTEVDGTVLAYVDDGRREALLSVDREIARHLVAGPLRQAETPEHLVDVAARPGPGGARHAVRRRLAETPVVYLDDFDADERAWLRAHQRREQRLFDEQFGLDMEIRAEGALLADPDDATSDVAFPGTGTVAQAALLTAGRLVEELRPADAGPVAAGGRLVIGVGVPDVLFDQVLAGVVAEYAGPCGWARRYVEEPSLLRAEVVDLLVSMRLLAHAAPPASPPAPPLPPPPASQPLPVGSAEHRQPTEQAPDGIRGNADTGLVLLAAAARYRPQPNAAGRPRGRRTSRAQAGSGRSSQGR
jgi:uncharacterized protein (TIGR02678 family)